MQTIRVRGPSGLQRVETSPSQLVTAFMKQVYQKFPEVGLFKLARDPSGTSDLPQSAATKNLEQIGLKHGDMLYLIPLEKKASSSEPLPSVSDDLDPVDVDLARKDGLIARGRDPLLCRHGEGQQCIHCTPLQPFDEKVLRDEKNPIKFLSFHSYLKKLHHQTSKGKYSMLEDVRCTIKAGCTGHAPWPDGICTKCQPSAVSLRRQEFRHVDYVSIGSAAIIDQLIQAWRKTGCQRLGILYGSYEEYDHFPLGIQAKVAAIYEPPQVDGPYGIEFDLREKEEVDAFARHLGLQPVGWIFTDLEPSPEGGDKVMHKRFLSSAECPTAFLLNANEILTAATFQSMHPNRVPHKVVASGTYGSKFVTIVVSGDASQSIELKAYQVSTQAMALVRDGCLDLSSDGDPTKIMVKKSSQEQYVPDVFYISKDKYGNEVKTSETRFPVEFFSIELEVGAAKEETKGLVFGQGFPVEHREAMHEVQGFTAANALLKAKGPFLSKISDFHFLFWLWKTDVLHLKEVLPTLLEHVRGGDAKMASLWEGSPQWKTASLLISSDEGQQQSKGAQWSCKACTYLNAKAAKTCGMCGTSA